MEAESSAHMSAGMSRGGSQFGHFLDFNYQKSETSNNHDSGNSINEPAQVGDPISNPKSFVEQTNNPI